MQRRERDGIFFIKHGLIIPHDVSDYKDFEKQYA